MSRLKDILNREPIFINPYTDFGFKRLFGEEGSKDLLKDFLNQILPQRHKIHELTIQNGEQQPNTEAERKAYFDIRCQSITGEKFIIEMQKAKLVHFQDRTVFYLTFPIQEQAQKGEWNFELKPIYLVAILDFMYDEHKKRQVLLRKVALKDQFGELFSDKVHLRFIQMPIFNKKENELKTRFDKWLYFLQNLENFDEIPRILNEPIFQKGFEIAKIAKMTAQEYRQYESSRLAYSENKAIVDTARQEGFAQGEEKGKIEEREFKNLEFTLSLIENTDFSNEKIARLVGDVTVEYVEATKKVVSQIRSLLETKHSISQTASIVGVTFDFVKKIKEELDNP